MRDVPVRAERGHHDADEHQDRRDEAVDGPRVRVQAAVRILRRDVRGREQEPDEVVRGEAAEPAEEIAIRQQRAALDVVARQFRSQRRTRCFVARDRDANHHRQQQQVHEELEVGEPVGGIPQKKVHERNRHCGCVQERMPAPPARTPAIGHVADERIEDGVEDERDVQREAGHPARQAEHLAVHEQHEVAVAVVFDADRNRTEAVEQLRREVQLARRGTTSEIEARASADKTLAPALLEPLVRLVQFGRDLPQ